MYMCDSVEATRKKGLGSAEDGRASKIVKMRREAGSREVEGGRWIGRERTVQLPYRVIASIDKKISSDGCYDAQQLVRTLYFRYLAKQDFTMATELCRYYALKFASLQQEELAVDLSMSLLSCLEEEHIMDEEHVLQIRELFYAIAEAGGRGRGKYKFINRAIRNSRSAAQPFGDVRLHRAAADAYRKEQRYGQCQGHLIFCRDARALAMLLREWETEGYVRERPLFWLRVVLILLCLKDVETAEQLLELAGQDWSSPNVPAPFQVAYLLVQACKGKDRSFFLLLQQKYHLILRKDDFFLKCIAEIEKRLIGQQPRPLLGAGGGGLASLFSSLLAGMQSRPEDDEEDEEDGKGETHAR